MPCDVTMRLTVSKTGIYEHAPIFTFAKFSQGIKHLVPEACHKYVGQTTTYTKSEFCQWKLDEDWFS